MTPPSQKKTGQKKSGRKDTGAGPKGSSQDRFRQEEPGLGRTAQAAFQHQPTGPAGPAGFQLPPAAALVELQAQLVAAEDATAGPTAGRPAGLVKPEALQAALAAAKSVLRGPQGGRDLSVAAAGLAHAIAWAAPPFARGNAAAAFLAVNLVLELNALYLDVTEQAAVETMGALAAGSLAPAELARWIAENSYPLHRWYL